MKKINWGIIALGNIAHHFAKALNGVESAHCYSAHCYSAHCYSAGKSVFISNLTA